MRATGPLLFFWVMTPLLAGREAAAAEAGPTATDAGTTATDAATITADPPPASDTEEPRERPESTTSAPRLDLPPAGHLVGRVVQKGGPSAVDGASLTIDLTEVATTDAQGDFSARVPCGRRRLAVQAPGFEPFDTIVDVCASPEPMVLRLVPSRESADYQSVVRGKSEMSGVVGMKS